MPTGRCWPEAGWRTGVSLSVLRANQGAYICILKYAHLTATQEKGEKTSTCQDASIL